MYFMSEMHKWDYKLVWSWSLVHLCFTITNTLPCFPLIWVSFNTTSEECLPNNISSLGIWKSALSHIPICWLPTCFNKISFPCLECYMTEVLSRASGSRPNVYESVSGDALPPSLPAKSKVGHCTTVGPNCKSLLPCFLWTLSHFCMYTCIITHGSAHWRVKGKDVKLH